MAEEGATAPRPRAPSSAASLATGAFATTAGALIALAASAWLGIRALDVPPMHASTTVQSSSFDLDGDGLADALERRLGTDPARQDTDLDGFSDSEELARGSSPISNSSTPGPDPLGLGLVAYQRGGPVQLTAVVYMQDGDFGTKELCMGARVGSWVRALPLVFFLRSAVTVSLPGADAGSLVMVVDSPIDPLLVRRFGSLSFYATLSNQTKIADADAVNLLWKDDLVLEYQVTPMTAQPGPLRQVSATGGTGSYEPLDPEAVPPDWTPDQICTQTMMVAATIGPVIVQEVVDAGCEEGWDAYCDPGCAATIGTTVETLDPGALIGG